MTTQPGPDARPTPLHKRLTVALAAAGERSGLAEALHRTLSRDLAVPGPLLRAEDLWQVAGELAALRADDRVELRSRLDAAAARAAHECEAASSHRDALVARQTMLLEGAEWALDLLDGLAGHRAAVDEARCTLDARRADLRTARAALDRVLEQRAVAAAAVEEADRELGEMTGVSMDESGLRRELEASGRRAAEALEAHEAAAEAVRRIEAEHAEAQQALARLTGGPGDPAPEHTDAAALEAVLDAYEALRDASLTGQIDRDAEALADAWEALASDLAEVVAAAPPPPEAAQLRAAEERLVRASDALLQMDRAASEVLSADERAAIEAAHAAVLAAEERLGRRLGAGAARQRLEAARAAERELLDAHGFASYVDVVLSGGRVGTDDPARAGVEREYLAAGAELDALRAALHGPPELAHLRSERRRLLAHASEMLGVDPGERVAELLRAHPQVPRSAVSDLHDALARVGVEPVATPILAAAEAWLRGQHWVEEETVIEVEPRDAGDRAALEARVDAASAELLAARQAEAEAGEAHELAQRTVAAIEEELTMRAGEDVKRLKRLAAAEQLRAQVDAVQATLARAEDSATTALADAEAALHDAEGAVDQETAALAELARRGRDLSEQLPIDLRVEGDPLDALELLASRLRAHATVVQPEIEAADAAVAVAAGDLEDALAAAQLATAAADGPQRDDVVEGFMQLLAGDGDRVVVLDEPFAGVDSGTLDDLLSLLRDGSAERQVVLLTADPEILGWAIELPADVAAAMPADALLARAQVTRHDLTAGAEARPTAAPDAETSAPDPETSDEPTSSARRWAGQR